MDQLTSEAVRALRAGDPERARQMLAGALLHDRTNVAAWLWLSAAAETDREREACLRQALALDPRNPLARNALDTLQKRRKNEPLPKRTAQARTTVPHPIQRVADKDRQRTRPAGPSAARAPVSFPSRASRRFYPAGRAPEQLLFHVRPSLAITIFYGLAGLLFLAAAAWLLRGSPLAQFLLLLPTGVTALSVFFLHFLSRLYARYTLTHKRLVIEGGLARPLRFTLPVSRVTAVICRRSWFGLLFHTADLIVVDQDGREVYLYAVTGAVRMLDRFAQAMGVRPPPRRPSSWNSIEVRRQP